MRLNLAPYGIQLQHVTNAKKPSLFIKIAPNGFLNNSKVLSGILERGDSLVVYLNSGNLCYLPGNTDVVAVMKENDLPAKLYQKTNEQITLRSKLDNAHEAGLHIVIFDEGKWKSFKKGWYFNRPLENYKILEEYPIVYIGRTSFILSFMQYNSGLNEGIFITPVKGTNELLVYLMEPLALGILKERLKVFIYSFWRNEIIEKGYEGSLLEYSQKLGEWKIK